MTNKFRSSRFAVLIGALLVFAIAISSFISIWLAREQSIAEWRKQLSNLSLILAEQTSQELTSAYLVLDSIAESVQGAGVKSSDDLRKKMGTFDVYTSLRNATLGVPQIDVATIVAANGDVINFTRGYPAPAINLVDRDYFRENTANAALGVFISKPVRNKGNKQWTFYLCRRLNGPKGEFIGLVLVGLSTKAFSNFYEKISLGEGATITLYRRDFTVLARWPHLENIMGEVNRTGSSYKVIEEMHKMNDVIVTSSPRFSDSGRMIYRMGAPRVVDKFPLIVNITVTEDLFLAQWYQWAFLITAVACGSIGAVVISFWQLVKTLRRSEANMALTEQLKQESESASRAKSDFLTMMSHEIRTPLTSINGFAELLMAESDNAKARERGQIILKNGRHLLSIINDILDISKIEANRLELEEVPFSPLEIIYGIKSIMSAQASSRGVALTVRVDGPMPSRLVGDPTCWRQILFNLCSNAVKFTEHGNIELILRYDARGSILECRVCDTGIGISDEQLKNLFKPFSQADRSISRKYGGTGLGLYLVDQLARRMGGKVTATSELGTGSTFMIVIPAHDADDGQQTAGAPAPSAAASVSDAENAGKLRGRVLLAEDGSDNRTLICILLTRLGLDYVAVENGAQVVELAQRENFDVILMDIQMPVMDGVAAARRLRAIGYASPVVALTANVMADDIKRYLEAGFTCCASKPIDFEEFRRCLASMLAPAADQGVGPGMDELPEIQELRQAFEQGLPNCLAHLAEHLECGQWTNAEEAAHTLKGTAGSFGYPRVTELAAQIERALTAEKFDQAHHAMKALWSLEEVRRLLVPRKDEGE